MFLLLSEQDDAALYRWENACLYCPIAPQKSALTLDEAWNAPGSVFLFLKKMPEETEGLCSLVGNFLSRLPKGRLFLWLPALENTLRGNAPHTLRLWDASGRERREIGDGSLDLKGCRLLFPAGGKMLPGTEENSIRFTETRESGPYLFSTGQRDFPLSSPPVLHFPSGELRFSFRIEQKQGTEKSVLQEMGISLSYACRGGNGVPGSGKGFVERLSSPLFRMPPGSILDVLALLHPCDLLDTAKTKFTFQPHPSGESPPVLESSIATIHGRRLRFRPGAEAGFTFAREIEVHYPLGEETDSSLRYGLTFSGCFLLQPDDGLLENDDGLLRIACGYSGTEYIGVLPEKIPEFGLRLQPGFPSFFPSSAPKGTSFFSDLCTTARVQAFPSAWYYAQPGETSLYQTENSDLMSLVEAPVCPLSPGMFIPFFPYDGYDGPSPGAVMMETQALAPERRALIRTEAIRRGHPPSNEKAVRAMTPDGILVELEEKEPFTPRRWNWIGLANTGPPERRPSAVLTSISPALQSAFQDRGLWLILSDPRQISEHFSTPFLITERAYLTLCQSLGEAAVLPLKQLINTDFDSENKFRETVTRLLPGAGSHQLDLICRLCAQCGLSVEQWHFNLSPLSWRTQTNDSTDTVILFKYRTDFSITDLLRKEIPASLPLEGKAAENTIRKTLESCLSEDGDIREEYRELHHLARNPLWTGVLFLNVPVEGRDIPEELSFIMSGVDLSRFYAHHLAVRSNNCRVEPSSILMEDASLSGLVDYRAERDNTPLETLPDYDFNTVRIYFRVDGTSITHFQCTGELLVNRLFHSPVARISPDAGNALLLEGVCQKNEQGLNCYLFSLRKRETYALSCGEMEKVLVQAVGLSVSKEADKGALKGIFQLSGSLFFKPMPACDLLAFGGGENAGLRFGQLSLCVSISRDGDKKWTAPEDRIALYPGESAPRRHSMADRFPMKLKQFDSSSGSPTSNGFQTLSCPLKQGKITDRWCGLVWEISLGALGALSSQKISLELLIAWENMPSGEESPLFAGYRFSEEKTANALLPLQGFLTLGFKTVEILVNGRDEPEEETDYLVRLRNFGIHAFTFSFPPGNNDIFLFANPESPASGEPGWYAAFCHEKMASKLPYSPQKGGLR